MTRPLAEPLQEPRRDVEHAARLDVLAQEDHAGVAFHLLRDSVAHGFAVAALGHQASLSHCKPARIR